MAAAQILINKVTHARLLPQESAHAFNYPTIALLLPLHALERNELDLARGWLFGYGGIWGRLTGLRPEAYLYEDDRVDQGKTSSRRGSILDKLMQVISERGYPEDELQSAWMLTMPSYLGFEGINPLTVYFVYKDGSLWLVVLEIHNTFSERHVHILCVGRDEDGNPPCGYAHSWTFARQFHVSPFNDRSGYYNCAIVPPYGPPFSNPRTTGDKDKPSNPLPTIHIQLYTQPTPSHPSQLKLTATLRATNSKPLTTANLLTTLAYHPFVLFLSFVRIAYHAWILHYVKGLDVYVRPEPAAGVEKEKEARLPHAVNMPCGGAGGGVGWQTEGLMERYARRRTERFLARRAGETHRRIVLESTNPTLRTKVFEPSSSTTAGRALTITYRSPRVFTLLIASPSVEVSLAAARDAERLLGVSDDRLFREVMAAKSSAGADDASCPSAHSVMMALRNAMLPRSCRAVRQGSLNSNSNSNSNSNVGFQSSSYIHPLDVPLPNDRFHLITNMLTISILHTLSAFERVVFSVAGARFVRGDEPWLVWERAGEALMSMSRQRQCQIGTEPDRKIGGGDDGDYECEYGSRVRDGRGLGSVRREK